MELFSKKEKINDKQVKIKLWDTAGQEQFKSLTRNFFHNADGAIIMYDVTVKDSYNKVREWIETIKDNATEKVKVCVVGNKIDLESQREVSSEDAKHYTEQLNLKFFETSALQNINLSEVVRYVASQIIETREEAKRNILLTDKKEEEASGGCRC